MANIQISGLTTKPTPVASTDMFAIDQNGTNLSFKITVAMLETYFNALYLNQAGACRLATTANLTATYNNGTAGVGATLTNAGAMAALQLDGVSAAVGDRILVKDQSTTFQNGIYIVTAIGSGASNWVLTRATDFNTPSQITAGDQVTVAFGTINTKTQWLQTAVVATIGTDPITFAESVFINLQTTNLLLNTGGAIRANTSNGNTGLFQAYDVDDVTYRTFGTLTSGNTPSLTFVQPSGGTLTWDGGVIGGTTRAAGYFSTLATNRGNNTVLGVTSLNVTTVEGATDVNQSEIACQNGGRTYTYWNLRSRGTESIPLTLQDTDDIYTRRAYGFDGADWVRAYEELLKVDGTVATDEIPSTYERYLLLTGDTSLSLVEKINNDGTVYFPFGILTNILLALEKIVIGNSDNGSKLILIAGAAQADDIFSVRNNDQTVDYLFVDNAGKTFTNALQAAGIADEIQFEVKGNATQTSDIVRFTNNNGSQIYFQLSGTGTASFLGVVNSDSYFQSDSFRQPSNSRVNFENTGTNTDFNSIQIASANGGIYIVPAVGQATFIDSALRQPVRTATSGSITLAFDDYYCLINKTIAGVTTVNLPDPATIGSGIAYVIIDVKGDAATNNTTIVPAVGLINGAANYVMNVNYQSISVMSNGSNYFIC